MNKEKVFDFIVSKVSFLDQYYYWNYNTSVYTEVNRRGYGSASTISELFDVAYQSINYLFEIFGTQLTENILDEFNVVAKIYNIDKALMMLSDDNKRLLIKDEWQLLYINKKES